MSTQTKTMRIYSITSALLIVASLASPAYASKGGNGPGNGTDDYANGLALKKLMDNRDGLTVEEKLYDLWVRAEGAVPDFGNPKNVGTWVGLNVANLGDPYFDYGYRRIALNKYQTEVLIVKNIPALMAGPIEIKPTQTFAFIGSMGIYNGDYDLRRVDSSGYQESLPSVAPYEGREDLPNRSDSDYVSIKPIEILSSGTLVRSILNRFPEYSPVEYRQADATTLIGVRKAISGSETQKPCPNAKAVMKTVKHMVNVQKKGLFGNTYTTQEEREEPVFDHWELAKNYGLPGICEVHYLFKSKIDLESRY